MLCMDIRAKTWSKQDRGGIFRSSLWQAGVFLSAICTQGFEALIDKVSFIDRVGSNMVKKQRGQTRRNPATQSYRAYIWQPVVNVILGSALWLVLGFLNQTARRASGLVQKWQTEIAKKLSIAGFIPVVGSFFVLFIKSNSIYNCKRLRIRINPPIPCRSFSDFEDYFAMDRLGDVGRKDGFKLASGGIHNT